MNLPESQPQEAAVAVKRSTWRRTAITTSVAAHGLLALALLFIYLPEPRPPERTANELANSGVKTPDSSTRTPRPSPPTPRPADLQEVPAEQIKNAIDTQVDEVSGLNDEEKLSELEKNLQRLESISGNESVQQITNTVADTLGIDSETYAADKPTAEGGFDFDTAQLDDVTRKPGKNGEWIYQSTLVDSAGRKFTIPMRPGEGETLYSTFEQMKKYPLAQTIYRSVVMPLLQTLIASEKERQQTKPGTDAPGESPVDLGYGPGGGDF